MVHDHEAIVARTERWHRPILRTSTASKLLYGLYALTTVYFTRRRTSSCPRSMSPLRSPSWCWNEWAHTDATHTESRAPGTRAQAGSIKP
jgi:hypothetical protein